MNVKNFCPTVNFCVLALGVACIVYYLLCGLFVRFGQSMLWIWPIAGAILIARFFLARAGVIAALPKGLLVFSRTFIALCVAFFLCVECMIVGGMTDDAPASLDYLIVLGARVNGTEPSLALQTRTSAAAEYMIANPDSLVIVSGGMGEGEKISEAECMKNLLLEAGVAPERILMEDQSTSTAENIRFSYALIENSTATVGIVTNSYHQFRARLIARSNGSHLVYGLNAPSSWLMLPHTMTREFMTLVVGTLRGDFSLSRLAG